MDWANWVDPVDPVDQVDRADWEDWGELGGPCIWVDMDRLSQENQRNLVGVNQVDKCIQVFLEVLVDQADPGLRW